MLAYISGSPFVLQDVLGLSSTLYATAFGVNAAGLALASLISARLTARVGPRRQLSTAVAVLASITVILLADVLLGMPLWPTLILLFAAVSTLGFILGTGTALATSEVRDMAGTGSALLGGVPRDRGDDVTSGPTPAPSPARTSRVRSRRPGRR